MLRPISLDDYCDRKSFYHKCFVAIENGNPVLFSYGTKICGLKDGKLLKYSDRQSSATLRHIRAFIQFLNEEYRTNIPVFDFTAKHWNQLPLNGD